MVDDATVAAVERVLRSGMLAAGPEVAAFEAEFADWVGVDHAIAVANGTFALWIGMLAAGIEPGDEVVIPSFTFAGTAGAVIMAGATPVGERAWTEKAPGSGGVPGGRAPVRTEDPLLVRSMTTSTRRPDGRRSSTRSSDLLLGRRVARPVIPWERTRAHERSHFADRALTGIDWHGRCYVQPAPAADFT